ncbi:uncharacterized protein BXZ73DRAFT_99450 [Epithele typhae]|uniref:uncharacterized protein n=1 Tax=Epithele typhae TaxID=378194 RepID=UPI002007CC36|nr:uncharacterized protein BXZ73DRAFT_99450 [Epithele typhae]KAH9939247.1 hypothetical protein BXZ73DRAFT_99450 [Epithele typhae]
MASSLRTPDSPPKLGRTPSYIHFTPRRAMASFENLVVLANYEERIREARKVVWRDRGEKPVEVMDLQECLEHALRGGARAATLGFLIRSGISFILLLTRIRKVPKQFRLSLIRHALFGEDSFRLAGMLGTFVTLYKFILNSLPLVLPQPQSAALSGHGARERSLFRQTVKRSGSSLAPPESPLDDGTLDDTEMGVPARGTASPRRARLSMSAQAHQIWVRKQTRRWYSAAAGAIAGSVAILCEKRTRRAGIAQQMFVRGIQGSFNAMSDKHGWKVPHGDVLIFSLCCGQILYAFLMRPDTLSPAYNRWVQAASKVPAESIKVNMDLVRDGKFDPIDMERIIALKRTTENNRLILSERVAKATLPEALRDYGLHYGPCAAVHPECDSCLVVQVAHFWEVFRWMLPIYGALHLIPLVLFRRKKFAKEPLQMLMRAALGTGRSSAFLGTFVLIYQSYFCGKNNAYDAIVTLRGSEGGNTVAAALARTLPQWMVDIMVNKAAYALGGLLCGMSLFVEEKHRREELAMYVLPKGLESAWVMARGRGWVFPLGRAGSPLLSAIGMGMVMSTYQNDPQYLSGLVRRILYQFVGPN